VRVAERERPIRPLNGISAYFFVQFFRSILDELKKATRFEKLKGKPGHIWPKHKLCGVRAKLDLPKLANKLIIKRRYSATFPFYLLLISLQCRRAKNGKALIVCTIKAITPSPSKVKKSKSREYLELQVVVERFETKSG